MEYTLLPFYILSTIHQAINSIINKSIFVMGLRQLRKWNRKSLFSLASKSIFSKLFFLQHFYLSLEVSFSLVLRCSTLPFYLWDLYPKTKLLSMHRPPSHLDCMILEGRTVSYNSLCQCAMLEKVIKFTGVQGNNRLPPFAEPCHTTLPACGVGQSSPVRHWQWWYWNSLGCLLSNSNCFQALID